MDAIIAGGELIINDELLSKDEYIKRRLHRFWHYFQPRTIEWGVALLHTRQVFAPSVQYLTYPEIHQKEVELNLRPSDLVEFTNSVQYQEATLYHVTYYEVARAWQLQRIANVDRVSAEADCVFYRRNNTLLQATDILQTEIERMIRPVSPLPMIDPRQMLKNPPYRTEYLPLSAIRAFKLSEAERKQALPLIGRDVHSVLSALDSPVVDESEDSLTSSSGSATDSTSAPTASASPAPGGTTPDKPESLTVSLPAIPSKDGGASTDSHGALEVSPDPTSGSASTVNAASASTANDASASTVNAASASTATAGPSQETTLPQKVLDIVTGQALPANKQEAEHGATERYNLLLSALRLSDPHQHLNTLEPHTTPFFPEFAHGNRTDGEIFCICGQNIEDEHEGEWMACDVCGTWQHVDCMGDGVPEDHEQRYECQQCDPFRHRELVARLRRENPLPQEVMPVAT